MGTCDQKRGYRLWNLATWSGASGSDTSRGIAPSDHRPRFGLGPAYLITYSSEGSTATQLLYPLASGGPWEYLSANEAQAMRRVLQTSVYQTQPGWWHGPGGTSRYLLGLLRSKGLPVPAHAPVTASPSGTAGPWIPAVAVMALLALVIAGARRGRDMAGADGVPLRLSL
jgi:hypothetical protein